ncbi:MAG: hypothetical protein AB1938_17725 [Myxococcota bacterium]
MSRFDVVVTHGDILTTSADVVVMKHAQSFYSLDGLVASKLEAVGIAREQLELAAGEVRFIETRGALAAPVALFVGTVRLGKLGYFELRQFAARVLTALEAREGVKHVVCTVHGADAGLDEDEAVLALVGGFVEAFQKGSGPRSLERITIIEKKEGRARRLQQAVVAGLSATPGVTPLDGGGFRVERRAAFVQGPALASAGTTSASKPHAFVAMPFVPELEDVFHYGIQGPVRAAGLLCERVDQAVFDGPIIQRIRERIESAKVVIADLSMANPNVYLEVGYAWGRGRPTVLLVRDVKELRFDVASYRCLVYRNIRDLETLLTRELATLS